MKLFNLHAYNLIHIKVMSVFYAQSYKIFNGSLVFCLNLYIFNLVKRLVAYIPPRWMGFTLPFYKHPIITALKKKGWVVFEVTANKISDGITGGVWIDCCQAYDTEYRESHKKIHHLYLGDTLGDAIKEVKSDDFPSNIK